MSQRPLILVVDDMVETRHLMRRVLERSKFKVIEASTGEDGLRAIERNRPELVVLDLRLPRMSGYDVARAVRSSEDANVATTVLLACSASVQPEVQQEAIEAGCDAFEGKPFDIVAFPELIRGLIAQHRRE